VNLPIQVPEQILAFFKLAIIFEVGSEACTLFWIDKWLSGQSIVDLIPHQHVVIPKRTTK
jgi:hypothetical protein